MKTRQMPKTDSIRELAEFWDSHDLTDFQHTLTEVTEPVFVRGTPIQVDLPDRQRKEIQRIARSQGVSKEELIKQWVLQKLARKV